jgi:hypothetical protein
MITKAGVPGKKVIVSVTSYGRSFKMAKAGCWGPSCVSGGAGGEMTSISMHIWVLDNSSQIL